MPPQIALVQVGVDVLGQDGAPVGGQAAGVDHDRAELGHEGAVDELLADEDHVGDPGEQVLPVVDRQDDAGHRHDPGVTEGLDDLMEGLGVEHGVGVDGHEQVGVTDLPETVHLRVALALIGGALPAGVDAGQRRLPDEPVPLLHVGALGGAVVDDVDLGRRCALVQQGGEHPHHDVGILVVERYEHGDPMRLTAADHTPLETGHHELHGHDHEEHVEGPHDPRVQDVVPADQHAPA